jgi:hypothetical protein
LLTTHRSEKQPASRDAKHETGLQALQQKGDRLKFELSVDPQVVIAFAYLISTML